MLFGPNYHPEIMDEAFVLAEQAEEAGNLPIAAIIFDGEKIVAVGQNETMSPLFHPGRHAEILTLNALEDKEIRSLENLDMYTTLEPCVMCLGSIVLHRIRTLFYAACDTDRGATYLLPYIAQRYPKRFLPELIGPTSPERGDKFFIRAREMYRKIRLEN